MCLPFVCFPFLLQPASHHLLLQDANLPLAKMCSAYQQMVRIVRQLYQTCRLVHADLSEYNILVHKVGRLAVGQSVTLTMVLPFTTC
jgi:serine/threonine-protein kinase RIO1